MLKLKYIYVLVMDICSLSFLFQLCGLIVVVVGAVVQVAYSSYDVLITDSFFTAPALLITAGVFTILASTMSCYGIMKENSNIIVMVTYITLFGLEHRWPFEPLPREA